MTLVAGNWKMFKARAATGEFCRALRDVEVPDGVGAAAEALEDADLVLHLRAAGDEHERSLHVAEQPAEVAQLVEEQEPGVRGQQLGDTDR